MTKRIYIVTALLLACTVGALGASLHNLSSSEEENEIEDSGIERSEGKMPIFEMTRALLREQMARAVTNSEVLTVNVTNLIIMLVVKAIIFGFGFIGSVGRRSSPPPLTDFLIDRNDLMLTMGFAMGSTTKDYDCLYRTACEEPEAAQRYMTASKIMLKATKMFKYEMENSAEYEDVLYGMQEAVEFRKGGGKCSKQYVCKATQ